MFSLLAEKLCRVSENILEKGKCLEMKIFFFSISVNPCHHDPFQISKVLSFSILRRNYHRKESLNFNLEENLVHFLVFTNKF